MKTRTITSLHYFEFNGKAMKKKNWDEILSSAADDNERFALSRERAKGLRWLERHPFSRIFYMGTNGHISVTDDRMVRTDYVDNTPTLRAQLVGRIVAVCDLGPCDTPKEDTVVYGRVASIEDNLNNGTVVIFFEGDMIDPLEIRRDFAARLLYFGDAEAGWLNKRGIQLLY